MTEKIQLSSMAEPATNLQILEEIYMLTRSAYETAYDLMSENRTDPDKLDQYADLTAVCTMLHSCKDIVEGLQENDENYDGENLEDPEPHKIVINVIGGAIDEVCDETGKSILAKEVVIIDRDTQELVCAFCGAPYPDEQETSPFECEKCGAYSDDTIQAWIAKGGLLR